MEFLNDLNAQQYEAVTYNDGPLLILAGAGTGKTMVLTYKMAFIVKSAIAEPRNILAVTFTNKASNEMSQRMQKLIGSTIQNIGTFHSVAARILRQNAERVGLNSNFSIINPDDQIKLIKNTLEERNLDTKLYQPKVIMYTISKWKDYGLKPSDIKVSDITSSQDLIARQVYDIYQQRLIESNSVDFGDLLLYNNEIFLNNPEVLSHYQSLFKRVLIDEYQDTNPVQYLWARMIANEHKHICCVGDDDQSIYSWRGAEVGNILRFADDFSNAKVVKLEQNYRSTNVILTSASTLIENNDTRHSKKLWSEGSKGELISVVSCYNDREEAKFIGRKICEISNRLIAQNDESTQSVQRYSTIAVLVRAGAQTRMIEETMISMHIPYKIVGGMRFYDRMEIRDAMAYIRLTNNNNDNIALERIINVPKRAIGEATLNSIKSFAAEHNVSLFESIKLMLHHRIFKGQLSHSLTSFVDLIVSIKEQYMANNASLSHGDITKLLMTTSGYTQALEIEKNEESKTRIENLNELYRAINEFENIEEFLKHATLVMDHDEASAEKDQVSIMTIHAAKGLEFETVFLPGMEEGMFPHQKSLDNAASVEEERRLAYVAITRAKKRLIMTYAETRRIFYEYITSQRSRFIDELPKELCTFSTSTASATKPNVNFQSAHFKNTNRLLSKPSHGERAPGAYVAQGRNVLNVYEDRSNGATTQSPSNIKYEVLNAPLRPLQTQQNALYKVNDTVVHEIFGIGTIKAILGNSAEINFPKYGVKKIGMNFIRHEQ